LVYDPGKLVDRAVIPRADTRGMSAMPGDRHRPAPGAAPRDRAHVDRTGRPLFSSEVLEIERGIGLLALGDKVAAGDGQGIAGIFLVAGQEDGNVRLSERSRRLHRAKRRDNHRDPALVVAGPRTVRALPVELPALKR